MLRVYKILLLILVSFGLKAQVQFPPYLPNPNAPSGYYKIGYMHTTGGLLFTERDTFCAKYPTLIKHTNHNFYYTNGNCTPWFPLTSIASVINIINNNSIAICSNGNNLCDTIITNVTPQLVFIIDSVTIRVCDTLGNCENFTIPETNFSPFVDSTKIIAGIEYYYKGGIAYIAGAVGVGGGAGVTLGLAPIGSTPNANAATLVGDSVLNFEPADVTYGGIVTASNTTQRFHGQKDIESASGYIFEGWSDYALAGTYAPRTILDRTGQQIWYLHDGTSEAGNIGYGTPIGHPGILFRNTSGTGRSEIKHYASTGGLSMGAVSTSNIADNQFVLLPNGHTFITGAVANPSISGLTPVVDNGFLFNVLGTSYFNDSITANNLSGVGTRMVVAQSTGLLSTQAIPSGLSGIGNIGSDCGLSVVPQKFVAESVFVLPVVFHPELPPPELSFKREVSTPPL